MESIFLKYSSIFEFAHGPHYKYLPSRRRIEYPVGTQDDSDSRIKLLHEVSHGLLDHDTHNGLDQATMEHDANQLAHLIAEELKLV